MQAIRDTDDGENGIYDIARACIRAMQQPHTMTVDEVAEVNKGE